MGFHVKLGRVDPSTPMVYGVMQMYLLDPPSGLGKGSGRGLGVTSWRLHVALEDSARDALDSR